MVPEAGAGWPILVPNAGAGQVVEAGQGLEFYSGLAQSQMCNKLLPAKLK